MQKRSLVWLAAVALVAASVSGAFAHNLSVVTPSGQEHHGWVGALALPGVGQGLMPGGPGGEWMISPAHYKGLNNACGALGANGNDVVDIRGPGGPGCPHGQ